MALFKPTWMVKSIYNISPKQLQKQGINVILTDLDNTLIPWNNPNGTEKLKIWLKKIHDLGMEVIVVSNNNHDRVEVALQNLNLPFISKARKPLPFGIKSALSIYDLKKDEVVMVGDQLLTDVLAANLSGIRSILVQPLVKSDGWQTRINRFFESFVVTGLKHKYPNQTWKDDIN